LGEVARLRGDYPRAAALLTQAITLGQQYHLTMVVSQSQANLAYVYCQLGHYAQASSLFKAILREHQQAGSIGNILADLAGLACVAAARQQAHTAAQLFGFVAETLQRFNVLLVVTDHDDYLRGVAQAQTQLDAAAFEVAQSMGRSMTMEQAVELGLGIEDSEAAR
jgi:tetratricopeptide (TPR) repeat protein